MLDRILPIEDEDVSKELERNFRKYKMELLTNTKVLSAKAVGEGVEVKVQLKGRLGKNFNCRNRFECNRSSG